MRNPDPIDPADIEALETREWLDSLDYVLQHGGPARVGRLLHELGVHAQRAGVRLGFPVHLDDWVPGLTFTPSVNYDFYFDVTQNGEIPVGTRSGFASSGCGAAHIDNFSSTTTSFTVPHGVLDTACAMARFSTSDSAEAWVSIRPLVSALKIFSGGYWAMSERFMARGPCRFSFHPGVETQYVLPPGAVPLGVGMAPPEDRGFDTF